MIQNSPMVRALKRTVKHAVSKKYQYLRQFDIQKGDVIIDLGANVGEVSEYFLAKGAQVYAYEPNPHAFEILKDRVEHKKNVILHKAAVSNYAGNTKLWLHEQHANDELKFSQSSSLQSEKENVSADSVDVSVVNISEVLQPHDKIKLIKIDIEGGEYDIMDEIMRQADKISYVLLETHEKKNPAFRERHDAMIARIQDLNLGHKIFMDWF